jgi:hypothetical protein
MVAVLGLSAAGSNCAMLQATYAKFAPVGQDAKSYLSAHLAGHAVQGNSARSLNTCITPGRALKEENARADTR